MSDKPGYTSPIPHHAQGCRAFVIGFVGTIAAIIGYLVWIF